MIFPVLRTDEYQKILVLIYLVLYIVHIKYCSEDCDSFICHEVMGPDAMILVFGMLSFKQGFFSLFSPSSRVPLHFLPLGCH